MQSIFGLPGGLVQSIFGLPGGLVQSIFGLPGGLVQSIFGSARWFGAVHIWYCQVVWCSPYLVLCVCGHVSVQTPSAEQEGECMPFAAIGAFVKKEYAGIGVEIIGVEILQA